MENLHRRCFACREDDGLGLRFDASGADGVVAKWVCTPRFESYPGIVHGGIIATLLDAAMTQCLLRKGVVAVTGRLSVRYRASLKTEGVATVTAYPSRVRGPLHVMRAEVRQNGVLVARAAAEFMQSETVALRDEPAATAG